MIVHKHHRGQHCRSFFHRGITVGGRKLVEEIEDLWVLEVFFQKISCTFIEITKKPHIGYGMLSHAFQGTFRVRLIGRRIGGVLHHDVLIQESHIFIEPSDALLLLGKHAGELFHETVQIFIKTDSFSFIIDAV